MAGAPEAVRWLRDQGLTVGFTTNTTRSPRPPSPDRVARLGSPASEDELVARARELPNVQAHLDGKEIRQTIVVPRRLVNLVV